MRVADRMHEIMTGNLPPHTLLICERYGSGNASSSRHINAVQPYTIKIHPDVPFLCDLHAHLADSEIIGFLAGKFDRETNCLYIQVGEDEGALGLDGFGGASVRGSRGLELMAGRVGRRRSLAAPRPALTTGRRTWRWTPGARSRSAR
jgi:hypothetical protein